MSSIEQYVVSRELAEELKVAGYPQSSAHFGYDTTYEPSWLRPVAEFPTNTREFKRVSITAAPLSDELLEQLPEFIYMFNADPGQKLSLTHRYARYGFNHGISVSYADHRKLVDRLAKLWLYCRQHGYLPEEVKQDA